MTTKTMTITPEIAKEWLALNKNNRKISLKRVKALALDISNNNWEENGASIVFNESGHLIDGQHRLSAVIKANKPINSVVVFGVPQGVSLIDRGKSRSVLDTLVMAGVPNEYANRCIVSLVNKLYGICFREGNASDHQISSFIDKHSESLLKIYMIAKQYHGEPSRGKLGIKSSALTTAMFCAVESGVEYDAIDQFCRIVSSGFYSSEEESSAIVYRNDLLGKIWSSCAAEAGPATMAAEAAIYDFVNKTPRKRTYSKSNKHIYVDIAKYKKDFREETQK